MKLRAVIAIVALCSLTALLAGCGANGDKNAYVDNVNEIQQNALDAVNAATSSAPSNKAEFEKQVSRASDAIDAAVTDLGEVDVPSEAQDGHDEFVASMKSMRGLFEKTASSLQDGSQQELLAVITDLQSRGAAVGNKIDDAINKINDELGAS